jgi:hypothetical protein
VVNIFANILFFDSKTLFCFQLLLLILLCIHVFDVSGSRDKKRRLQTGQAQFSPSSCKTIYSSSLDSSSCKNCTYVVIQKLRLLTRLEKRAHLDQWLSPFQKVLSALRFRALLMPVYNSLIRYAVFVIQDLNAKLHQIICTKSTMETNFENLRECLDDASVLIAVNLYCIYQSDLSFRTLTERFKNGGKFLKVSFQILGF